MQKDCQMDFNVNIYLYVKPKNNRCNEILTIACVKMTECERQRKGDAF